LALLGEGAMGKVYLAKNLELGRKEAIKVLKPELAEDSRFAARFRREARATSRLYHPNIVTLYGAGTLPGGGLFISMEYVDGAPIESLLQEQESGLPVPRALTIVCQLASALEHAHSRGVVHRDLKPANIMLVERRGQEDRVKVLDFGVAKIISPEYQESLRVSQEGVIFGTPLYMAPEQFYEKSNDPRSDVYAIGCVVFELLTGVPPFTGKISEIVLAHTDRPAPSPTEYTDDISPELEEVVLRCLAKDPDDRFQTSGDLLAALVPLHPDYREEPAEDSDVPVPDLADYDLYDTARIKVQDVLEASERQAEAGDLHATDKVHWFERADIPEEQRHDIEDALRDLGAQLLSLDESGTYQTRLGGVLSEVRTLEEQLQHCATDRRALLERRRRVEVEAAEQLERLAHAIRELEAEMPNSSHVADIAFQVTALRGRLREVQTENEVVMARLEQSHDEIVVRRSRLKEEKRSAYGRLALTVDELAQHHGEELGVLLEHYQSLCELYAP
jgi:serine/threonine protein kinase